MQSIIIDYYWQALQRRILTWTVEITLTFMRGQKPPEKWVT